MSTNLDPPKVAKRDPARSLYAGSKDSTAPVGETIRSLIRKGRGVVRSESSRWQENRAFYDGSQWVRAAIGAQHLNQMNRTAAAPPMRPGFNTYNQLRKNVKARVALLTSETPAFDVIPEDNDQDSIEAANFAEKLVGAKWGADAWDIKGTVVKLAKYGDIDGISWLCVEWDPDAAESRDQATYTRLDGTPITDRAEYEALKETDPEGQFLWKITRQSRPIGDVAFRVVLPAALSVDPFAQNDFGDARWIAETRVRPRSEVERRAGKPFKQLVEESNEALSENAGNVQYQDLAIGDGTGKAMMSETDGVAVHYFYARPCPDFPKGARIEILDRAPATPLRAEPWEDDLPYFLYYTDEDPGHCLRAKGVVDDLKPVQRTINTMRRYTDLWMFKVAYAPLLTPVGSMRGQSFWNEDMHAEIHMANGQPFQYQTPAEPGGIFNNYVQSLNQEMEDLSGVSAAARGFTVPNAPESSAGISQQIQQVEHNLSEAEGHLKRVIEKGISRALKLVEKHYTVERTVTGVGADDASEFRAFKGSMIRGANRFRISSSMMPKSKAASLAAVKELVPVIGADGLQPYIADLIEGDTSRLERDIDRWRKHQRDEIGDMRSLVTNPTAQAIYKNFEEDKAAFAEAFNAAAQMSARIAGEMQAQAAAQEAMPTPIGAEPAEEGGEPPPGGQEMPQEQAGPMMPPPAPPDPMTLLGQQGITPPNLTQMLNAAKVPVPMVEGEDDNHLIELDECNVCRTQDSYKRMHPMFQQLLREHMTAHKQGSAMQVQSMSAQQPQGQQSGSAPNPKGTPSPPKTQPTGAK